MPHRSHNPSLYPSLSEHHVQSPSGGTNMELNNPEATGPGRSRTLPPVHALPARPVNPTNLEPHHVLFTPE